MVVSQRRMLRGSCSPAASRQATPTQSSHSSTTATVSSIISSLSSPSRLLPPLSSTASTPCTSDEPNRYARMTSPWLPSLWIILSLLLVSPVQGIAYTPVPSPDLDLTSLGRVALTGNFDAISLYSYQQQTENAFSTNGTQSIITQLPNGDYVNTASADGYIKAMCPFIMHDGTFAGVIVGGNFTSLGGVQAQGVAMYGPNSGKVTPLPGLTGQVNAIYCDKDSNTVYVGGQFRGANSTNAVAWVGSSGWANLPFEGFNGPVNSIIKSTNGTIIFGGAFTGLGNKTAPAKNDTQTVNIASANLTSGGSSTLAGFSQESNIVCKTGGEDGAGNTWLLQDNAPGFWRADMNFGFEPSLLRIYNTRYQGRGTKTFRLTAIPLNGIMNFTYTDPATGASQLCDARCPLSNDPKIPYQDFRFVNTVGMSAFRVDISEWYGAGGGLNGIELFQNDIFAYAESDLNEPTCAKSQFPSKSTQTGPWNVVASAQSNSRYLAADVSAAQASSGAVSVTLQPDVQQQGNYSVTLFTPGCLQDNSCSRRGIVNVTGVYSTTSGQSSQPLSTQIYQTNNYDKYDEIYRGPVDVSSGGFRPSVTISPLTTQSGPIMVVAQRVQFTLAGNATSALNGLFEWNPNSVESASDFTNSTIDSAGAALDNNAMVTSMAVLGSATYVAGNFTDNSAGFENIFAIGSGNATSLPHGGLNAQVSSLLPYADLLFVGGNFTNTMTGSVNGLNNVAIFNTTSQTWEPLGAGVNGAVSTIVALSINITTSTPELCISFNGIFTELSASGGNKAVSVPGFGIWVPSRKSWLQNLHLSSQAVTGQLSAMTNVTNGPPLLAGTLSAQDMSASDAVALTSNPLRLNGLNVGIKPKSAGPSTQKRATTTQNVTGIVTGLFHAASGVNVTILGGHFVGTASNGSTIDNLAIVNSTGTDTSTVSGLPLGLDADSAFLALATTGNTLYAGGVITGKVNNNDVNGLVVYDLGQSQYAYPQPPALGGSSVVVNAITMRPNQQQIYVGGSFDTAGSLGCPSVCLYENGAWSQPGSGLTGNVTTFMWQGNNNLLVGGNLTVMNNVTSLASYDASKSVWTSLNGANTALPGPVTALTAASNDATHFWVAGKAANQSTFLVKYDGSKFVPVGDLLGISTTVRGLQVLNLNKNNGGGNSLVPQGMTLMLTGELDIPGFGNASAALFNGTSFTPFLLSTSNNGPGSLSQLFSEKQVNFKNASGKMAVGFVVLIALACALGAIFLLVVAGILIERYRRKREGYMQAPSAYFDKTSNMGRIPPEHLFGRLGAGRQAPMI